LPLRSQEREKKRAKKISKEDFSGAMRSLASLRKPVDHFFDGVTVNTDDVNSSASIACASSLN